jgi:hypothetical protein
MKRERYNITIHKGESFALAVALKDSTGTAIDLTNATLTSQCRDKSSNAILFSFVCTVSNPTTSGQFTLSLGASTSASLTPQKALAYDVKISWTNGTVKKYLGGDVQIVDTITP